MTCPRMRSPELPRPTQACQKTAGAPKDLNGAEARPDVYHLGATLYALLTGETPAGTGMMRSPRSLNPAIPRPVERVVMKMLALQGENGYASLDEARHALAAASDRHVEARVAGSGVRQ